MLLGGKRRLLFGTERSEVRILSPRPNISITYCRQRWRPFCLCGGILTKILRTHISLKLDGTNVSHCRLQILGVSKSYNSSNQQTGTGFIHDSNGNPTTYGGTTLTFDPENRITAYGSVLTAGYTGDGLRAWKENSTARTYFLYDGILPVVEMNSSGAATATNTFGVSGLLSRRESTSAFFSF